MKIRVWRLLSIVMLLSLVLASCGVEVKDLAEAINEKIPAANPVEDEKDSEDEDNTLLNVLTDQGSQEISKDKWPKELKGIPEFIYGDLTRAEKVYDEHDGIDYTEYRFQFENIEKSAGEDYSEDLEKAGFDLSQAPRDGENPLSETTFIEYDFARFELEVNDLSYSIQADFWIDSIDEGALFIVIPSISEGDTSANSGTDGANGKEDENDDEDEEYDEDRGEIAADYPHKDAPFYSGQLTLELAFDQMIGEMKIYSIIFSTSDDIEKVKEEILETYTEGDYEVVANIEQMGALTMMVENDDYNIRITVAPEEELDEATMIQYTVSPSEE